MRLRAISGLGGEMQSRREKRRMGWEKN